MELANDDTATLWKTAAGDPLKIVPDVRSSSGQIRKRPGDAWSPVPDNQSEARLGEEEKLWLRHMEKQFREIAGEDEKIDLDEFKRALDVKESFFADRFFALFDADNNGWLTLDELVGGLNQLCNESRRDKLRFLFDVYDVNGSGSIDRQEVLEMLKSCVAESSIKVNDEDLEELATLLFDSADKDGSGFITFEEMLEEFEKHPETIDALTISAVNWLKPPDPKKKKRRPWMRYCSLKYIQNNLKLVLFMLFYTLINFGLFALNAALYRDNNGFVVVARGAGMVLNFNGAFVLVLMLRYTLTWLRSSPVRLILPLDDNVMLHKMVGYVICAATLLHTVCHLINIQIMVNEEDAADNSTRLEYWEYLFTLRSGIGWVGPGFAYLSGVILDVILIIMFICSMSFVRRGGYFQVFYWTHMLYIAFFVLLILHGPLFYWFFLLPGLIFLVEKIYGSRPLRRLRLGRFFITQVNLLPSKVTHLIISRPDNFEYKPGDYVFIQIPDLAANEWHPFTISSAPELKGEFWLHIRGVGNWSNRLHEFFKTYEPVVTADTAEKATLPVAVNNAGDLDKQQQQKVSVVGDGGSVLDIQKKAVSSGRGLTKNVRLRCYIDGPYGTPTRDIMNTEHAVLIGSGIGVTPFASILQSIMYRRRAAQVTCPGCKHSWYPEVPEELLNIKKVDFIWINRNQRCFEWFVSLLTQLEAQEAEDGSFENFFNMQMFMTSAASKNDMKGIGLQMALDLLHAKRGTDLITGLKTKTMPGRPNWQQVFEEINKNKRGRVKVYFCGASTLAKILSRHCDTYMFEFHKESF